LNALALLLAATGRDIDNVSDWRGMPRAADNLAAGLGMVSNLWPGVSSSAQ